MKKRLAVLLASTLVSMSICGCGALDSLTGGAKAKTAQEVISNYTEKEDKNNLHTEMVMGFNVGIEADGMKLEVPINIDASIDTVDKNNMHANMKMEASMFGMSTDSNIEVYINSTAKDGIKMYTCDSDTNQWYITNDGSTERMLDTLAELDESFFENATMEYDKETKSYVIEQPFKDFNTSGALSSTTETSDDTLSSLGLEQDVIDSIYENAKAVYTFDKDYNIVSLELVGANYSGPVEMDGRTAEVSFNMDLKVEYSNHGQIKLSDITVPQEVVDSAVEDNQLDEDFGGYEDDPMFSYDEEGNTDGANNTTPDIIDPEFSFGESNTDGAENNTSDIIEPGLLGTFNGVDFTGNGDSWDATFGTDGWNLIDNVDEYTFIAAENEKYGDYAILYVYNKEYENTTKEDILTNGIYGYDLDFGGVDDLSVVPDISWKGVKLGASAEDIKATYGEPSYVYNGTMYDSYTYELADRTEIEFQIYFEQGLKSVRVSVYSY